MQANFILPGMYEHAGLNLAFIKLMREHPEYFYPEASIGAVYGNFQFCIFDGGRIFNQYRHTNREEVEHLVNLYNKYNIPVRLVFTNPMIKKEHFQNRFGQMILEICHNGKNEIVVNDEEFEQYLRNKYPNFQYISSTTKCLNTPNLFKLELDKDYKMICLDYNLNKNWKMLNDIDKNYRNKCEFLVNAICPPGCPNRKEHYRLNGLFSLNYGRYYSTQNCPIRYDTLHPMQCASHNNLTPDDIYNTYLPQGFENFKLEGRTLGVLENLCNYVKYMVKPEYQFFVINYIINENPSNKLLTNDRVIISPNNF